MTKRKIDVDEIIGGELELSVLQMIETLNGKTITQPHGNIHISDVLLADDGGSLLCTIHDEEDPSVKDYLEIFVEFVRRLEDVEEEELEKTTT